MFVHIVEAPDGGWPHNSDRIIIAQQNDIQNESSATSVSTAVSFPAGSLPVDSSGNGVYGVHVSPSQQCTVSVTNKTASGFLVTLYAASIGLGTFDVLVTA